MTEEQKYTTTEPAEKLKELLAKYSSPPQNIKLDYRVRILHGVEHGQFFLAPSCEFFLDEHGFQWVKFVPRNGYQQGYEHMMRTERIIVIRDDGRAQAIHAHPGQAEHAFQRPVASTDDTARATADPLGMLSGDDVA